MKNPATKTLNAFYYRNELYIRTIPGKALFNSTMVHQVVNRGDVFALRVSDQSLTIVPGKAAVVHVLMDINTPLSLETGQLEMEF